MRLHDVLQLPALTRIRVVAGQDGLSQHVRWVHVVDIPDVRSWVRPGQLLLTTGYAWPRKAEAQRKLIRDLHSYELVGAGMAVPQFFERFPRAAVEEAERLDFPLLEIPWEIPFATIIETVTRALLAEQAALLERSEAIHRALTRAAVELDGLDAIVRRIVETLDRTAVFFDANGRLVAFHPHPNEGGDTTGPTGLEDFCKRPEVQEVLSAAHSPVQVEHEGVTCLVGPVRLGQRSLGFLVLIGDDNPFNELDLRAVEHATTVVALFFSHQQRLELVQTRLRYGLVDSLIEGRWDRTPEALERARLLGLDPEAIYVVCILLLRKESIPLDGEEAFIRRERVATEVRQFLARNGWPALITVSLNRVVAVLPDEVDPRELWNLFDPESVAAGVSDLCAGLAAIPAGFHQAAKALEWNGSTGFCRYRDTLLPRLLEGDDAAREMFVTQILGPLLQGGRSDVLLSTLRTLARNDFSQRATADALHVHANTLRYRMQQIERLLELDLTDPDNRFSLRLAIEILDVGNKSSA